MISKFVLNLTPAAQGSTIELDGQPLRNVRAIHVDCVAGEATKVSVEFAACHVEITGATKRRNMRLVPHDAPASTFWARHKQEARGVFFR